MLTSIAGMRMHHCFARQGSGLTSELEFSVLLRKDVALSFDHELAITAGINDSRLPFTSFAKIYHLLPSMHFQAFCPRQIVTSIARRAMIVSHAQFLRLASSTMIKKGISFASILSTCGSNDVIATVTSFTMVDT